VSRQLTLEETSVDFEASQYKQALGDTMLGNESTNV